MAHTVPDGRDKEIITPALREIVADWSADQEVFRHTHWGKAMMWIFLLSDTFIFSCFLTGYMTMRASAVEPWPNTAEVFALNIGGHDIPLVLMAMAVNFGYRRDRRKTAILMLVTALFGLTFLSMQAFEWSKLIFEEGVRPWSNPMGAPQFGASFFMITGFHGLHVTCGVILLLIIASKVARGHYDRTGDYSPVEIAGLYWHFVDLVWGFIFAFVYRW